MEHRLARSHHHGRESNPRCRHIARLAHFFFAGAASDRVQVRLLFPLERERLQSTVGWLAGWLAGAPKREALSVRCGFSTRLYLA